MKKMTLDEWRAEAVRLFGDNVKNWRFVCPACGHVQTVQDLVDAGAAVDDAYQNCIGRFAGKGSPKEGDSTGCNWAAYGLFGTLGKGLIVDNEGTTVEVFAFDGEEEHARSEGK